MPDMVAYIELMASRNAKIIILKLIDLNPRFSNILVMPRGERGVNGF